MKFSAYCGYFLDIIVEFKIVFLTENDGMSRRKTSAFRISVSSPPAGSEVPSGAASTRERKKSSRDAPQGLWDSASGDFKSRRQRKLSRMSS